MSDVVWILGAHMTKFSRYPHLDTIDLAAEAAFGALDDAGVTMADIGVLATGNMYEASGGIAQRLLKQIGQTGIPAYNVANACATGASAVRIAHTHIRAGEAELALAVGVEQMGKVGLLGGDRMARQDAERFEPSGRYGAVVGIEGRLGTMMMPGTFAQAGTDYAHRHGVTREQFAMVAEKNHAHSALNPLSQYQTVFSLDEILAAEMIAYPNTKPMCCPTSDGAAAVVLVSDAGLKRMSLEQRRRAVKISASVLTTDHWTESAQVAHDINTLTRRAADQAYEAAGIGPSDLDLVELHDCFATAEVVHYDNLRLCEEGGAADFIEKRAGWRDGPTPVNVSGGLLSKGHPVGATGVANLYEVATHLRGEAGDRQIPDAKVGLAHVIGIGSTCGVHILERSGL